MNTLVGKRALVTGGASGIGKAIAQRLAAEDAELLLVDRSEKLLGETAAQLVANGRRVRTYVLDVTHTQNILAIRDQVHRDGGPIDLLVNNAGLVYGGSFLEVPLENHLTTYRVNTLGVVAVTHTFLPDLIAGRDGHIVNVASASGLLGCRSAPPTLPANGLCSGSQNRSRWSSHSRATTTFTSLQSVRATSRRACSKVSARPLPPSC